MEVEATYGCDSTVNSEQPKDGCSIGVEGEACLECVNNGDSIFMAECANLGSIFQPSSYQTISLSEGGGFFDVSETDAMCNHPSVTMSAGKSGPLKSGGSNAADAINTLKVSLTLTFDFVAGKGVEPDVLASNLLVANTIDFFRTALMDDSTFENILASITMEDIRESYSVDQLVVTTTIRLRIDSASWAKNQQAADAIANADLYKYLHNYVRHNKLGNRDALFYIHKVHLKAVAKG